MKENIGEAIVETLSLLIYERLVPVATPHIWNT